MRDMYIQDVIVDDFSADHAHHQLGFIGIIQ